MRALKILVFIIVLYLGLIAKGVNPSVPWGLIYVLNGVAGITVGLAWWKNE